MSKQNLVRHEKRILLPHPNPCNISSCICRLRPKRSEINTCNIAHQIFYGPCIVLNIPPSHALRLKEWFHRKYPGELDINITTPHMLRIRLSKTSSHSRRSFLNEIWTHVSLKKYFNASYILEYSCKRVEGVAHNAKLVSPEVTSIRICAPKKDCEVVTAKMPDDIVLDPRDFTHVLFVVRDHRKWWWGIQPKVGLTFMHQSLPKTHEICRAELKLKEVFELFSISGPFETTLDIGSSPGGWTKVLSDISKVTVSVDSGALHPAVIKAPGVLHIRKKWDDAIGEARLISPFDLIVCDINAPFDSLAEAGSILDTVRTASALLSPVGSFVLTLKLTSRALATNNRLAAEMANVLKGSLFASVDVVHLLNNSRKERTLYLQEPIQNPDT